MSTLYGIYGIGGCGRGIMPIARQQLSSRSGVRLLFIADGASGETVNGNEVLTLDAFMAVPADGKNIAIAIASPQSRQAVAERCRAAGASFFEVRA
ncbi:MAG TPA: acetyltransferase, partial [Bradyrhizobium sp.]|nr:acetyltransferase [Bradyrhizobium sp.]